MVTIAARRATAQFQRHLAKTDGGGKVRGDSAFELSNPDEEFGGIGEVMGSSPTPEVRSDDVRNVCGHDGQIGRRVAPAGRSQKFDGYTNKEIAEALDCTVRTVDNKLNRIQRIWTREEPE